MMNRKRGLSLGFGAVLALLGTTYCSNANDTGENGPVTQPETPAATNEQPTDEQPVVYKPGTAAERADFERRATEFDQRFTANPNDPNIRKELADLKREADRLNGLVVSVAIEPGHTVKFYDPGYGVTVVAETRRSHQTLVLKRDKDKEQDKTQARKMVPIYESLRPGMPVPQVLIDMDQRTPPQYMPIQNGNVTPPAEGRGGSAATTVPKHATSSCQHFLDHDGCPAEPEPAEDFSDCVCSWGGGAIQSFQSVKSWPAAGNLGPGVITARGVVHGSTVWNVILDPGEDTYPELQSGSGTGWDEWCNGCGWGVACPGWTNCRQWHTWQVLDATNDVFHYGVTFFWD